MALVTLDRPISLPAIASNLFRVSGTLPLLATSDNYRLDNTRTKMAIFGTIPASGDITAVHFNLQAVTTDKQVRVSIQTIGTNGLPSGSTYKTSAYGDDAIALAANTIQSITLGTKATSAVAGDAVAIVFEWADAEDMGDIRLPVTQGYPKEQQGAIARFASDAWTVASYISCLCGVTVGGVVLPLGGHGLQKTSVTNVFNNNTGTADEHGNYITVPFACRTCGIWANVYPTILTTDTLMVAGLSNSSRTLQRYVTRKYYESYNYISSSPQQFMFSTPLTLNAGDSIYVTMGSQSTSVTIQLYSATLEAAAHGPPLVGLSNCIACKRLDAISWSGDTPTFGNGAYTTVDTEVNGIGILIDQLDDGAGGGGGGGASGFPRRVMKLG